MSGTVYKSYTMLTNPPDGFTVSIDPGSLAISQQALFAAPPPIGSTSPNTGAFTTLQATTPIGITSGGTGTNAVPGAGSLLIGNSAAGWTVNQLTAGPGINIANSSGAITISGAVTGSSFTRTTITASGGQTTFSVSYSVGSIQVYLNGVMLAPSDYTATSGTSVVLGLAAAAGDIFDAFSFTPQNITGVVPVVNGGSGTSSLSGYVYGNGTSPFTASTTIPTTALSGILAAANGGTGVASTSLMPVTATGSTTARTLAARAADFVNLKDFGAVGDGVTDDTVSVNAWIAEVLSTGNVGYAPAGNYKVTSPILIDYVSVATTGFTLMGAGVQRTVFTSTVTTGAAFQLYCSGGTVPSPKIGVYPKITQLAFYASTVGPTLRIGNYDFSDQQNLVRLEIWCSNSSNDSSARCIEMNSCYGCYIQYNGGLGATNPPSYTLSAAGINLSLRQCSFSQFFISIGSTANNTTGAILGTATGVCFSDGFSYGNVFTTPDVEIFDVAVRITSANAVRNTFVGGQWAYKSYGVVATTGNDNVFINPNINATTAFFQSGVNAVGVSRVDATSLFDYQISAPTSGGTVTSGTVRILRLTQGGTLASLTITLPPSPFDGQMFDIFTTYAITALTLTPTPFDTITTLPASSKVSFLFNAGGNQWIRVG